MAEWPTGTWKSEGMPSDQSKSVSSGGMLVAVGTHRSAKQARGERNAGARDGVHVSRTQLDTRRSLRTESRKTEDGRWETRASRSSGLSRWKLDSAMAGDACAISSTGESSGRNTAAGSRCERASERASARNNPRRSGGGVVFGLILGRVCRWERRGLCSRAREWVLSVCHV